MAFNPKWIIGRTIVAVEMNPFRASDDPSVHRVLYSPIFTLDNGAELRFVTEESDDVAEYGTAIVYLKPERKRRNAKD